MVGQVRVHTHQISQSGKCFKFQFPLLMKAMRVDGPRSIGTKPTTIWHCFPPGINGFGERAKGM